MYDRLDLGNLTSREIGDLMTKSGVDRDRELLNIIDPDKDAARGDLSNKY